MVCRGGNVLSTYFLKITAFAMIVLAGKSAFASGTHELERIMAQTLDAIVLREMEFQEVILLLSTIDGCINVENGPEKVICQSPNLIKDWRLDVFNYRKELAFVFAGACVPVNMIYEMAGKRGFGAYIPPQMPVHSAPGSVRRFGAPYFRVIAGRGVKLDFIAAYMTVNSAECLISISISEVNINEKK